MLLRSWGDAAGQLADGLHLLRVAQLRFRRLPFGDVEREDADARRHRLDQQVEPTPFAGREGELVQHPVGAAGAHHSTQHGEHRRPLDPGVARHQRAPDERVGRLLAVNCRRPIHIEVGPIEAEDLNAFEQVVDRYPQRAL